MNSQRPTPTRSDRLEFLLVEQSRVRRSRVRRRNAGLAAAMILLVGGVAWLMVPQQPVAQPKQTPVAGTQEAPNPEQPQIAARDPEFRIVRVEQRPLQLIQVQGESQPCRVEYINDLQLFIAMREQGIDAGLMRINGKTQLAFNDEESRRRFEEGFDSPE